MSENTTNIDTLLASLAEKQEQKRHLEKQLHRSLALRKLWPDAFANGPANSFWVRRGENCTLTVTNGNGERRTFKREDVPEELRSPELEQGLAEWRRKYGYPIKRPS